MKVKLENRNYIFSAAMIISILLSQSIFSFASANEMSNADIRLSCDGKTLNEVYLSPDDTTIIVPESVEIIASDAIDTDLGHVDYHPIDIIITGDSVEIKDNAISGIFHKLIITGTVTSIGEMDADTYIEHLEFHQFPCLLEAELLRSNIGDVTCLSGTHTCIFDTSLCGKKHIQNDYETFVRLMEQGKFDEANSLLPNRSAYDVISEMIISADGDCLAIESLNLEPCSEIVKLESGPVFVKPYGIFGYSMTNDGELVLPDTLKYVDEDALQLSFRTIVFPLDIEEIKAQPNAQISQLCFKNLPPEHFAPEAIGLFETIYLLYESRSDLKFCRMGEDWKEDWNSFIGLVREGKYDEALAIQNLDGKHPSAPSGSGNGAQPAEPQTPTSSNTAEPSGQLANDPSTHDTQADPQAPVKSGEDPASSGNSGTEEPSEDPAASRNPSPAIATALILATIAAAVLIRKHK